MCTCESVNLMLEDGLSLAGGVPLHVVLKQLLRRTEKHNQSATA